MSGPVDVSGKRVVVTGAGRGIGRVLAAAFSESGARVALVARTEAELKALAEELPGPTLVLPGDVTAEDFNETVADATVAEWGGVDVWIGNAGISPIVAGPRETAASVWREGGEVQVDSALPRPRGAPPRECGGGGAVLPGGRPAG